MEVVGAKEEASSAHLMYPCFVNLHLLRRNDIPHYHANHGSVVMEWRYHSHPLLCQHPAVLGWQGALWVGHLCASRDQPPFPFLLPALRGEWWSQLMLFVFYVRWFAVAAVVDATCTAIIQPSYLNHTTIMQQPHIDHAAIMQKSRSSRAAVVQQSCSNHTAIMH